MRQVYLENIYKSYPNRQIFSGLSWQINCGEKYALVGRNGVGKTTLFRIIKGEITPDEGQVLRAKNQKIGYMPQEAEIVSGKTLWLELLDAFRNLLAIKDEIRELEDTIAEDASNKGALEKYGKLQEEFEIKGGFDYEEKIKIVLHGLGFPEEVWLKEIKKFSGGEKNRIFLAKILLEEPDLLLLDEPTNYLDIESTQWLEEYLSAFKGSVIIVSHDRYFMNRVARKTAELTSRGLEIYHGNYDFYEKESAERLRLAQKAYEHQAEEIERIKDFIQKNIAGQKTKQAQSRRKKLQKMEPLEKPHEDNKQMKLDIRSSGRSWQRILEVNGLSKSFDHKQLFDDISFKIERGEKIGLIGPNGSGKTTLIRMITGQSEPDSGQINIGNNVEYTYYDQELVGLDMDADVIDVIWEEKPQALAEELRSYLGRFLFTGEDIFRPVKSLSGGEKSRLSLAKIFVNPANFLILDEPTNHLDIPSVKMLERALSEFSGTVLIISHDRYFLDNTVRKILAVENRDIKEYPGNFSHYWEKRMEQEQESMTRSPKKDSSDTKAAWEKLKDQRRHQKRIERAEMQIALTEAKIEEIAEMLIDPELSSDWEKLASLEKEKSELEKILEKLYEEYEELTN
ncbi:MAG TPA: ATP-binding cassette domain-containing protein [candidate division Zixibacteria bacterium]|nr:ATP-binding cassette domain-containing protein [candidate division Zixibacteria bacterium]